MPAGAIAMLVEGGTGRGGDGIKLRRKEQDAIRRLEALADYCHDTLWLDSASGTLTVMGKGERTKTLRPSPPCSGRASATKGRRTRGRTRLPAAFAGRRIRGRTQSASEA